MASIAMMVGGAIVNALTFSGSNLFSSMRESNAKEIEEERKRHKKALKQLETAQSQWDRRRMERLDFRGSERPRDSFYNVWVVGLVVAIFSYTITHKL